MKTRVGAAVAAVVLPSTEATKGKRRKSRKEQKDSLIARQASPAARDRYIKSQESDMALWTGAMATPQAVGGPWPDIGAS